MLSVGNFTRKPQTESLRVERLWLTLRGWRYTGNGYLSSSCATRCPISEVETFFRPSA